MPCAFRLRRFEREWLRAKPPHLRLMFNSAVRTLEPHWLAPDAGQGRVCGPRFTISLKRSALIFSYPQAGRPITPSIGGITDINGRGTSVNSIERTLGPLYRAAPLRYIPFPCWPRCDQSAPNDFAKICHSGARVDACAGGRGILPNRSERSPCRTAEFWSAGHRHQRVRCWTYSWVLEARLCYRSLSAFRAAVS